MPPLYRFMSVATMFFAWLYLFCKTLLYPHYDCIDASLATRFDDEFCRLIGSLHFKDDVVYLPEARALLLEGLGIS